MQVVKILLLGTFCLLTYGGENQLASGQQRQHFRNQPEDQHVVEGAVAIIKCEVGNQKGRVQWAKDGFVLGFNRTIPGYPRYEMVGDGLNGEHHLKIHNTTLHDDADYQCQVGPADGHDPLRATGHLTVLLAPTSIELLGRGREEVIEVNEGEEITLECQVEDAKPVAMVRWYKNNEEIHLDSRMDVEKESSQRRRHTLVSKVTLRLTPADDGSHYACHAEHPALSQPIVASVKISVLYPPGPPMVTGYTTGETIRAGEERTLSCRSRGGNPLGRVVWYRNNEIIDTTDRPIGAESVNEYKFIVDSADNGAIFTCEVRNKLTEKPLLASVQLDVQFPPDKVVVSGPTQSRVGENVTLTCVVENSNPAAEVSWVVDGQPRPEATTRRERAGPGGWHTVSRLELSVPSVDRDMMFTCHATNQALGETKVDTYMLSVLRPPLPPVLHGYSEGSGIRVGSQQRITCVSRGGNPPAHLQWYRDGQKIPSRKHSIDDVSSAEIEIVAEPQDNGAQYRCEAHNSASSSPVSVSTTLVVFFPPETVKVDVFSSFVTVSKTMPLTSCRSPESAPECGAAILTVSQAIQRSTITVRLTLDIACTRVTNVLALNLTAADDGLTYSCQAKNTALQKDVTQSVTLHVNYAPTFLAEPPDVVDVVVGESEELNLTARANPGPVIYTWTRHGLPLPDPVIDDSWRDTYAQHPDVGGAGGSRVSAVGPLLYIRGVTVDDAGDYELEATNQEGATVAKVYLNVQYPPAIKYTSELVTVSEGQDAHLECAADGNPLTEAMMAWRRDDYDFTKTEQIFGGKKATLTVLRANRNDTGVFTCEVNNSIGKVATANITLVVKTKPIVERSQLLDRAAAEKGQRGELRCLAEGAPDVSFSWKRDGLLLSNGARPDKYENETVRTGLVSWASTFYIRNVHEDDYGRYECIAENELGASTFTVRFIKPTGPDPPLSLKVVNTTHDTVTLTWKPGFDGGKTQYFRLRYRTKDSTSYQYLDVYEAGVDIYTVVHLNLNTEYYFSIMSYNDKGDSEYRGEFVRATTRSEAPPTPVPSSNVGKEASTKLPGLWVVIIVLVATALLALNVSAIVCIVRRRRNKRASPPTKKTPPPSVSSTMAKPMPLSVTQGQPLLGDRELLLNQVLGGRGDLPKLIIIVVAIVGTMIVILNIALVICLIRRKRGKRRDDGSDQASSKSTTNTMYAPSSYNDTVVGETLSSISEKSRESYTQEDSVVDYEVSRTRGAAWMRQSGRGGGCLGGKGGGGAGGGCGFKDCWEARDPSPQRSPAIECRLEFPYKRVIKSTPYSLFTITAELLETVIASSYLLNPLLQDGPQYFPSGHAPPAHLLPAHFLPGRLVPGQVFLYDQYDLLYGCEQTHKHAASTYLIDQIEPPPEYASQTPSQPSSAAYDPHEDDYAEVLRRNAYNHQLGKVTPRPPSRATHYSTSPENRGYLSFSYTPSPTGVPNGAAQYHAGGPSVTLGLHDHAHGYPADMSNLSMEGVDHAHALQSLGLDSDPPPSLGLEQHSIPSEHPSLTLDPHSITIDHPVIAVTDFSNRNGDLRVQPTSLSTFNPNPSPSTFSESDLEGHLV
ncbi:LOW QUALITY PROTEIN: nephrin-like [Penaeus monodon]|uniref:LOW QUALITY PROTEIN: nephrin-like n=1 Tax=Penaeus monodon TaxID=6687 RepID=UPI0018A7DF1A|nr:LOW QUALITY PROTEIN: nephrin-like [Penaeus monodon]